MSTKSEKMLAQVGKTVLCDICRQMLAFGPGWMMTADEKKDAVCPGCVPEALKSGKTLVGI